MKCRPLRAVACVVVQSVALLAPLTSRAQVDEPSPPSARISLAGTWNVRLDPADVGVRDSWQSATFTDPLKLPSSLTENNIGEELSTATRWTGSIVDSSWFTEEKFAPYRQPGNIKLPFWLTPQKHYVGPAWYQREILIPDTWEIKEVSLFLERAHWETRVWLDGTPAGVQNSLCAPHEYALGSIPPGRHILVIRVDNRPKINVGRDAHSICDHTQTNWNGMIGRLELRAYDPLRIADLQIYPDIQRRTVRIRCAVANASHGSMNVRLAFWHIRSTAPHNTSRLR